MLRTRVCGLLGIEHPTVMGGMGTRFLATDESPIAKGFKQAIVESDGHDTLVTDIPDVANGQVWPGAYVRVRRNRFIEEWLGRDNELRRRRVEVSAQLREASRDAEAILRDRLPRLLV